MFFLNGVARFLFVPMAESVMFAMVFSFLLSRTLVPTMAKYLLRQHEGPHGAQPPRSKNPLVRFQRRFEALRAAARQLSRTPRSCDRASPSVSARIPRSGGAVLSR